MKNEVDQLTQEQKENISSKGEVTNIPVCEQAAIMFINFFILIYTNFFPFYILILGQWSWKRAKLVDITNCLLSVLN